MQDQFMFIHDAILESVTCGDTQIAATNLRMSIAKMKKKDNQNEPHGFKHQFNVTYIGTVWYGVVKLVCACSNRFWSRCLLTPKRCIVVEL